MNKDKKIAQLEKERNENFLNYTSGSRSQGEFLLFIEKEERLRKELEKIKGRG